jgi:hypothetical protein
MYIRKGFEPLFDAPIKIANPHEAIGTYLFTAVASSDDQATLRWMVVPLAPSSAVERAVRDERRTSGGKRSQVQERIEPKAKIVAAASAALDRLDLPQDAVDRISVLVSVGATIIISEHGLGRREAAAIDSDFTVLLTSESPTVKPRPQARPKLQAQQQPESQQRPEPARYISLPH